MKNYPVIAGFLLGSIIVYGAFYIKGWLKRNYLPDVPKDIFQDKDSWGI